MLAAAGRCLLFACCCLLCLSPTGRGPPPLLIKDRCHRALSLLADSPQHHSCVLSCAKLRSYGGTGRARRVAHATSTMNLVPGAKKKSAGMATTTTPRSTNVGCMKKPQRGPAKNFYGEERRWLAAVLFCTSTCMSIAIENIFQVHVNRST